MSNCSRDKREMRGEPGNETDKKNLEGAIYRCETTETKKHRFSHPKLEGTNQRRIITKKRKQKRKMEPKITRKN